LSGEWATIDRAAEFLDCLVFFIEAKGTTALVKRQGEFHFMFPLNSRPSRYFSGVRVNSLSVLLIAAALFLGPITQLGPSSRAETKSPSQETRKQISLPTPRSHYDTFKRGTSGLPLLMELMKPIIIEFLVHQTLKKSKGTTPATTKTASQ